MLDVEVPPSYSSQVHPDEITGSSFDELYSALPIPLHQPPLSSYQKFRFRGCRHLRDKMRDAMINANLKTKTIERFDACAAHAQLFYSASTGRHSIRGDFCKCRTCPPCAAARAHLISSNLTRFLGERHTRMITLTIKHNQTPLSLLITRVWQSFKLLRKTDEFKTNVTGWAAFLEVKWSSRSGWWHVHLHMLTEGKWWDQKELSRLWHSCTGDSYVVDIQAKGDNRSRAYYASKYASKPFDAGSLPTPELLAEAVACLHRRKLWQTGGEWRSLRLLAKPKSDVTDWEFQCGLNQLFYDADHGNEAAETLIRELVGAEEVRTLIPPINSS